MLGQYPWARVPRRVGQRRASRARGWGSSLDPQQACPGRQADRQGATNEAFATAHSMQQAAAGETPYLPSPHPGAMPCHGPPDPVAPDPSTPRGAGRDAGSATRPLKTAAKPTHTPGTACRPLPHPHPSSARPRARAHTYRLGAEAEEGRVKPRKVQHSHHRQGLRYSGHARIYIGREGAGGAVRRRRAGGQGSRPAGRLADWQCGSTESTALRVSARWVEAAGRGG